MDGITPGRVSLLGPKAHQSKTIPRPMGHRGLISLVGLPSEHGKKAKDFDHVFDPMCSTPPFSSLLGRSKTVECPTVDSAQSSQ